jgi:DNA processing protein
MKRFTTSDIQSIAIQAADYPDILRHIPDPPQQLYAVGDLQRALRRPRLAVVGSRKATAYARAVSHDIALAVARAGVTIVSGLAYGIDSVAHRAALDAQGITVAVMAGGLDDIYPTSHYQLAQEIIAKGGALLSEYPIGTPPYKEHFIARNRIVSGLSDAVLITEATEKSGTLHTARYALEQGRDVLAVPGTITGPQAVGTNRLIKTGAHVVLSEQDVLSVLGISPTHRQKPTGSTPNEQLLVELLDTQGALDGSALQQMSGLEVSIYNQTLTMLEITGKIRALGNNLWTLA